MSSLFVRDAIKEFLTDKVPAEKQLDLTGEFFELSELLNAYGIGARDPWLGVQFIGGEEVPVSLTASNTQGRYREEGVVYLHVVARSVLGGHNAIMVRCETIRNAFRGQRIDEKISIQSMSSPTFGNGAGLNFEDGYTSALIQIVYNYDLDL